jgi:hypothetical protein
VFHGERFWLQMIVSGCSRLQKSLQSGFAAVCNSANEYDGFLRRAVMKETPAACMQRRASDVKRRAVSDPAVVRRHDPVHAATVLFAVVLAVYMANGRTIWSWDTLAARYLPIGILRHGTFYLDEFPALYAGHPQWEKAILRPIGGHYVSFYPVGAPLVAAPFYAPAVLHGLSRVDAQAEALEKISAAAIVSLSVAFLYLALLHLTSRGVALGLAIAYAFGTSSFSVSSQALWQHGPSQLGLAITLLLFARDRSAADRWFGLAGFPLAMAVVCRPSDLFLAAPLGLYALWARPRRAPWLIASALPPVLFQLWYNVTYLGDPFWQQFPMSNGFYWHSASWKRTASMLFSPSRGLFVYSPIFLFSVVGLVAAWRRGGDPLLRAAGIGVLLVVAIYSKWRMWWAGTTYGPRHLADLSPLLIVALVPVLRSVTERRVWRTVFAVALAWSIVVHGAGAFYDDGRYSAATLWSWTDNQLVRALGRLLHVASPSTAHRSPGVGEVAQRHGRLLDLGMPELFPLERDEPAITELAERREGFAQRHRAAAGEDG